MTQLVDLTDESEPVNIPSTSDEHPNWRRRLSVNLGDLERCKRFTEITRALAAERGKADVGQERSTR